MDYEAQFEAYRKSKVSDWEISMLPILKARADEFSNNPDNKPYKLLGYEQHCLGTPNTSLKLYNQIISKLRLVCKHYHRMENNNYDR